ncbi:MAG: hypothetical protein M3Z10_13850, partial [Gemmatimonadota bacterium]|nr:hypothetical protein [Gemmatimonadota bacterium]
MPSVSKFRLLLDMPIIHDSFDAADGRQEHLERALELGGDGKLKLPRFLPECCKLVSDSRELTYQGVFDRCVSRVQCDPERGFPDEAGNRPPTLDGAQGNRGQLSRPE